jgi:predicted NACHT family NTPase
MQKNGHTETTEADALAQLTTFFRDHEGEKNVPDKWARGFLVIAHQRSGLLVEGAPNLYNFSHSNFREYLAANQSRSSARRYVRDAAG